MRVGEKKAPEAWLFPTTDEYIFGSQMLAYIASGTIIANFLLTTKIPVFAGNFVALPTSRMLYELLLSA